MYEYGYSYYGPMEESIEALFSGFSIAAAGIGLVIGIAVYVMRALALYRIAERRGLRHSWLAWIPVGRNWIIGSISDQYRYLVHGENTNRRRVLLWISAVNAVAVLAVVVSCISMIVKAVAAGFGVSEAEIISLILGPVMTMLGVAVLVLVLSLVYMVFYYISLSDLLRSCDPGNATLYLVLSILGNLISGFISYAVILEPVFLLVVHGKDQGMPPRREVPRQTYTEPFCREPEELWNQE